MPNNPLSFEEWRAVKSQGLDPLTMLPIKPQKTQNTEPPLFTRLGTSPSPIADLDELKTYNKRGIDVYSDSDVENLNEMRAEKQGLGEVFGNAAGRFYVGLVPEIIGSAGGVLDAPFDIARLLGAEVDFGNALTQWSDEAKKTVDEDWFPIYRSKNRDFMDVGDPEWWLENGSSLQRSAAGFMATGFGVGAGIKALGALGKGAALLETLGMAPSSAARVAGAGETLATAGLLNHAEGVMEATQVYNDTYSKLIANGFTEEDAKERASQGAAATVNANRINILLNLTAASKFFKPLGKSRNILEAVNLKNTLKAGALEGLQEAGEETINLLASEYGSKVGMGADRDMGTFAKGLDKVASMEGLESAFLGFLGGKSQTLMQTMANATSKNPLSRMKDSEGNWISKNKYLNQMYQEQQALLKEYDEIGVGNKVKDKLDIFDEIADLKKIEKELDKAYQNKDQAKIEELESRQLGSRIGQAIRTGTMAQFLETIDRVAKIEEANAEAEGRNPDEIRKKAQKAKELATFLEARNENNDILINRLNIDGDPRTTSMFRNFLRYKANALNTEMFLNKTYTEEQESKLEREKAEGFDASKLENVISPYVKKQAKELESKGKEYSELLDPATVQERYEKFADMIKKTEEAQAKTMTDDANLDNTIEAFKEAVTQSGYSQKVDENITDLPGIGRVNGVFLNYDGKTWRLTRRPSDGTLNIVNVEDNKDFQPFNRKFLQDNASKIGIISAEDVKESFRVKRDQRSKNSIIKSIRNILTAYEEKKAKLDKEIQEYQEQVLKQRELLEQRRIELTKGIKDREKRFEVLKDKEFIDLADTVRSGEKIIESLEEQKSELENAMNTMGFLGNMYLSDLANPETKFVSPQELRNELQRLQGENLFEQKERDILDKSIDDIEKAISETEKALEVLTKEKDALAEAYAKLSELKKVSDKRLALKYIELKKAIDAIKELENKLSEYKNELKLKTQQTELQKRIDFLDLHMKALQKRFKDFYEAPDVQEYQHVPDAGIVDNQNPEKQAKVWENAKSNSIFYTTGANVTMEKGEDKYDSEGKPVLVENKLEKNWFEFLDLKEISEGSKLMAVRYNPNPQTDKEKQINNLIEQRTYNPQSPVILTEEDLIVIMVTEDSTGVENFIPVLYKDSPLVSVLPIPGNLLKSWKDSKVNTAALVSMYAAMTESTVEHLDSKKVVFNKDGKREVRNLSDSIKEKIVERVREKMQADLDSLVSGDMLNIESVTSGHPVLYKEIIDGKLETVNRPFIQVFPEYNMKNGKPENFELEVIENDNPTFGNTEYEIGKGSVVVVKDDMPQTLYTRKLNTSEVDSILALLSLPKDASFSLGTYEKEGKKESNFLIIGGSKVSTLNVYPHFSTNPSDSDKVSLISLLMNYGVKNRKSESLNNWDIFKTLKGKIVFKFKDVVYSINEKDVLNPDKNKELREFLAQKKVNINKFLVGKNSKYFHPKVVFENGQPKVEYQSYKTYAEFIMNNAAVSYNYRTPEGQTLFQKNVVLQTDNTGSLIKNQTVTKKQPKPVVPTIVTQPTVPDVYEFTAPKDVIESIKFSAKHNNTLFKNYKDGLYKIAEEDLDKNGMTTKRIDSYFIVENGIFYPAPSGYPSFDKQSLDVMNTSPDNSLKQFSNETTKYSIEDVGIKQSVEKTKPIKEVTKETITPQTDIEAKTKEELFPIDSLHKGKESGDTLKVIGYTKDGVRFEIQTEGKLKPTKNVILSELKRLIKEGKLTSDIYAELAAQEQAPEPTIEMFELPEDTGSEITQPTTDISEEELARAKAIAMGELEETIEAQEATSDMDIFEENKSKIIKVLKSAISEVKDIKKAREVKRLESKIKGAKTQEDLNDLAEEVRKICNS